MVKLVLTFDRFKRMTNEELSLVLHLLGLREGHYRKQIDVPHKQVIFTDKSKTFTNLS